MASHYLDNFLAVFNEPGSNHINAYKEFFIKICKALKHSINIKKNITGTLAKFLKPKINMVWIKARLP